jgi:hypothetical protein
VLAPDYGYRKIKAAFLPARKYLPEQYANPRNLYLLVECAWCKRRIGWRRKTGTVLRDTSHGICPPCAMNMLETAYAKRRFHPRNIPCGEWGTKPQARWKVYQRLPLWKPRTGSSGYGRRSGRWRRKCLPKPETYGSSPRTAVTALSRHRHRPTGSGRVRKRCV